MVIPFWIRTRVVCGLTAGLICEGMLGVEGMAFAVIMM